MDEPFTPAALAADLAYRRDRVISRFWANVAKTHECWLWTGTIDDSGYGRMHFVRGRPRAHRFSYELAHGPIGEGQIIRHRCDVPSCVRPHHLLTGTKLDNARDRDERGRGGTSGERNRHAKLTAEQVLAIRDQWTGAYGQASALMREYGIKAPSLYGIVHGTTWKHLLVDHV